MADMLRSQQSRVAHHTASSGEAVHQLAELRRELAKVTSNALALRQSEIARPASFNLSAVPKFFPGCAHDLRPAENLSTCCSEIELNLTFRTSALLPAKISLASFPEERI